MFEFLIEAIRLRRAGRARMRQPLRLLALLYRRPAMRDPRDPAVLRPVLRFPVPHSRERMRAFNQRLRNVAGDERDAIVATIAELADTGTLRLGRRQPAPPLRRRGTRTG